MVDRLISVGDWRITIAGQCGSFPVSGTTEDALARFWRETMHQPHWPVLLVSERTKEIHLAARHGQLLDRGELVALCLDKMECAAHVEREQPGVWSFPSSTLDAMKRTVARVSALPYWREP